MEEAVSEQLPWRCSSTDRVTAMRKKGIQSGFAWGLGQEREVAIILTERASERGVPCGLGA